MAKSLKSARDLNVSIVLYKNDQSIQTTVNAVLDSNVNLQLYLIDNSPTDELKYLASDPRITYVFNNNNIGYGSGHNVAINKSLEENTRYHLVMNPDINFENNILADIISYMDGSPEVGSLMPKIFYGDGSVQRLCKLLPTPLNLIGRRFLGSLAWAQKKNQQYELQEFDYNSVLNTPSLSGCFMFIRTEVLRVSGLFDPRYFMYLEDYDLNRRIHRTFRTEFYPNVSVVHGYAKESYKNGALMVAHMKSAIKYFNKWGWLIDSERANFNKKVLSEIKTAK